MAKRSTNNPLIDGECELCGFPGVIGMTCSECHDGNIIQITDNKETAAVESDRYDKDLLESEEEDKEPVESIEKLADDELASDDI